ncbi:MAG: hypothetical protein HRT44_03430 [Bdellovibrionales bacterium]|nr:hypothetical protein [Bdellovibrionales bacterium]NQZ18297.1 hypothetical protein [Bdellovibrionales bacterium]
MAFSKCTFLAALLYSQFLFAEYRNLEPIMTNAARNGENLTKLLEDIQLKPTNKSYGGKTLVKVVSIKKGSIYEKAGIHPGDLVTMGNFQNTKIRRVKRKKINKPQKSMQLYQKLKTTNSKTRANKPYSTLSFRGQTLGTKGLDIYKDFELELGDTIVMYDGKPLSSPKDAMELYTKLKKKKINQLLIKRDESFKLISLKK